MNEKLEAAMRELETAAGAMGWVWVETSGMLEEKVGAAKARIRSLFAERDCGHPCHVCAGLDACREACRSEAEV